MDIDDKELFSSAMTDEPISDVADTPAEAPVTETPQQDGPARDEHGRFAPKTQAEPTPEPTQAQEPAKDEGNVPSWRLREVREEAERRVAETEARWQRQFELMQRQAQPRAEPQAPPDLFENPNGFVQQQVDPIKAEVQNMRENFSRKWAEKEHGPEKVRAAYEWIAQGIAHRDPDVVNTYNRVMQSSDPFDDLVKAHQQRVVHQTIGNDPNAWFEKELERRMGSDPQFAAKFAGSRQVSNGQSQGSITKLPPSLRNAPSARGNGVDDDPSDMSDAALFRHATR